MTRPPTPAQTLPLIDSDDPDKPLVPRRRLILALLHTLSRLRHLLRALPRPRPTLLLPLLLIWLLLTLDPFHLHWLCSLLLHGPPPSDPALSHNCPVSRNHTLPLAVVVPLIPSQLPRLLWTLARWSDPRFAPCPPARPPVSNVSLIFYFDRPLTHPAVASAVRTLRAKIPPAALPCFRAGLAFASADLSAAQTRNSYFLDPVRNLVHTPGSNAQWHTAFRVLAGNRFSHFFYMEPDTWPIRSDWLRQLALESRYGPFWMRGTTMRYAPRFNVAFEPFRTRYQRHLNGNAIYALDDPCFERFRHLVRNAYGSAAFDVAMTQYRLSLRRIMTYQEVAHRFQATELLVDIGVTEESEQDLLQRFPRTYLVHGKYMHVKHPAFNFMQYR